MSKIEILVRGPIHAGKLAEFKATAAEAVAKVKANEPGTERYEWYLSPDETEIVVFEAYQDSNAVLAHMAHLGETLGRLLSLADVTIEVFGSPSPELAQAASGMVRGVYPRWLSVKE
jgi:quinol monooxygenase YgiN